MKRLFPGHTIRGRLLFLAIVVEVVMLTILVFNSLRLLHGAMTNQARSQAEQFYPVLKAALTAPLAQRDYATVQAVVDESRTAGGVDYIVIVDRAGKRVGSSGLSSEQPLPEPSRNLLLLDIKKAPRYDVAVPISLNKQLLGTLHFGLNLSQIVSARHLLLTQGIIIAAVEIVLSSIIMLLIGYWLTRHLTSLTRASQDVADGNLPKPVPEGDDDVGQLGVAFNTMSRIITERVTELTAAKVAAEASERQILQSDEQLKLALAGADLGLWNWDLASGKVTYSKEWTGMLGYDTGELDSSINAWEALVHPDDMPMVQIILQQHISGNSPMYETEHRCRTKSGDWHWILDRGRVIEWTADGTPARAAGTHLDITDRKIAEEKLKKLNEELEQLVQHEVLKNREKDSLLLQQDKMASIGQLAAGVAHEINNPMGFIMSNLGTLKGYAENLAQFTTLLQTLISKECTDKEKNMVEEVSKKLDIAYILADIRTLITESTEGAERVKQIILDLKDFAHVDEKGQSPTSLNRCVESTLNMVRNEIKYVADIVLHLGELPEIVCSGNQINQVIANLLVNAGHAIDKYGTITVSTRQDGDHVLLTISDTGKGMTEEIRKRIFEPFFSTKEVGKGTGLGLTISYDIIKKHGGEILVESEPGVGTTFTVKLPINNQQVVPS